MMPQKPLPEWCTASLHSGPYHSPLTIKEITVQETPNLKYKLVLFVGSEAIDLQRKGNRTWAPAQHPYVVGLFRKYTHRGLFVYRGISPTTQVRVEIQMKSHHLPWAKKHQNAKYIGLQKLFNEYCTSKVHDLTVLGRSHSSTVFYSYLMEKRRGHCRWKVSLLVRINFLYEPYGPSFCNRPSHPASNVCIGEILRLVAQRTRRIVEGTLLYDGCYDRKGCGQGYQIRGCLRRGQLFKGKQTRR